MIDERAHLFDLVLTHGALAHAQLDRDLRFVGWSDRAAALFGWTAAEVGGRTIFDLGLIHPDDRADVAATTSSLLDQSGTRFATSDMRNVRNDGASAYARWFFTATDDGAGCALFALIEELSAERAAQMEVRAETERGEERFRSIFDNNPDPMLALDSEGVVRRVNAAAARALRAEPDALVGGTLGDIAAPGALPIALAAFNRAIGGLAGSVEFSVARNGSEPFPAFVTMIPIVHRERAAGVHLHVRDLRPTIAAQKQAAAHAERIRDLYVSAASANQTAERQIRATLEAGCRILGMSSAGLYAADDERMVESVGTTIPVALARLTIATERALAIDDLGDVGEGAFASLIGTAIEVAGTRYGSIVFADAQNRGEPYTDVDRDLVQLMGALVGSAIERGRSRAHLRSLAYSDSVTALPNRAWLVERLRDEIAHAGITGRSVGVLFLDLDRFKDINDTLGHASGDRVLRIVGERLAQAIRTNDVVARMGGDEFVVLALDTPEHPALSTLGERIIAAIEAPIMLDDNEHFITTSIGIAIYPTDGINAETLVKHADVAMYRAKERGRNTYQFFTPSLQESLQSRLGQEKSIRRGIERGEFEVFYQPIYDIASRNIVAVEALARWRHPKLGLVMPDRFIPNAELSGLIVALGDFVLETACADVRAFRDELGIDLHVAVNLSARQFHQHHLASKIRDHLGRSGLHASALELEITESVAMSDAQLSVTIMQEVRAEGVRLAVDDFGTGYSSLGYLRRFPLDSMKIDRSFIADLANEAEAATIVRTVIAMAHALGLEVVAEGVERTDQLDFLRAEECDRAQGFLFSPAIPRAALLDYLRAGLAGREAHIPG